MLSADGNDQGLQEMPELEQPTDRASGQAGPQPPVGSLVEGGAHDPHEVILLYDPGAAILDANPATLQLLGYSLAELRQLAVDAIATPLTQPAASQAMWRQHYAGRFNIRTNSGATLLLDGKITPFTLPTGPICLLTLQGQAAGAAPDTGASADQRGPAEQADTRHQVLLEAGRLLTSSLDYHTTLDQVARLLIPSLADWCVVDVLEPDGTIVRISSAHHDPGQETLLRELQQRYPPNWQSVQPAGRVLQTGRPLLLADISDELVAQHTYDDEHKQLLLRLRSQSAIALPLVARGETLGVLTLVYAESGRRYTQAELVLAEEVAQRAALAMDNARLYREAQTALQAREQALSAAQAERARLFELFMQAPVGICYVQGPEHTFTFANPAYQQLLSGREIVGKPVRQALPELEGQGYFELLDQVLRSGEPVQGNETLVMYDRHGDGVLDQAFFNFVYQAMRNPDGSIDGVLVHVIEVTEQVRRRREIEQLVEQLVEQREWLETTLRSIGDAVIATDTEGRVLFMNGVAQALTGWEQAEAQGRPLSEVFHIVNEYTRQLVESPVDKVLREGMIVGLANHTVLLTRDGRELPIDDSGAPIWNARGELTGVVLVFRDITERSQADAALRQSEERFRSLSTCSPVGIFVTDTFGRALYTNPRCQSICGFTNESALGVGWTLAVHPEDRERAFAGWSSDAQAGREHASEFRWRHADGTVRWTRVRTAPMLSDTGVLIGHVGTVEDFTERRLVEYSIEVQKRALEQLGEGAPLAAILELLVNSIESEASADLRASILLMEADGQHLRHGAAPSLPAPYSRAIDGMSVGPQAGSCGTAVYRKATVVVSDIASDPLWSSFRELALPYNLRACWSTPIISTSGQVLGTFAVYYGEPRQPGEQEQLLISLLTRTAAIIIERKQTEELLRASNQRIKTILESISDGFIALDASAAIIYINRQAEELLLKLRDEPLELHGTRLWDVAPALQTSAIYAQAQQALHEQLPRAVEWYIPALDRWCEVYLYPAADGMSISIHDITERKQAERERLQLLRREQRARGDLELAQQRLAFLAEASTTLASSLEYETTLQKLVQLLVPLLADCCFFDILQQQGQLQRVAWWHKDPAQRATFDQVRNFVPMLGASLHPAGHVIATGHAVLVRHASESWMQNVALSPEHLQFMKALQLHSIISVPLTARGRTIGGLTCVRVGDSPAYSADELDLAEELARRVSSAIDNALLYREVQQALTLRDQFLSLAAHELKTPMTTILGSAQLVERQLNRSDTASERERSRARTLVNQVLRLNRLISSLLDLSRIQEQRLLLDRELLDMQSVVQQIVEELRPTLLQQQLAYQPSAERLLVHGDRLRLEQCLQNLLHNAVKYSPEGGLISVRLLTQGQQVLVEVSDQGLGIPERDLPRIFERFYRASNVNTAQLSGMGIGLYVVSEIVALHGGRIEVESQEGRGSRFRLLLPRIDEDDAGA